MKIGDKYPDTDCKTWEIICTNGPREYPYVGKLIGSPWVVGAFNAEGHSPQYLTANLKLAKTVWLAINKDGTIGTFPTRPSEVGRAALIKVSYEPGQFDE